jgi:putative transposase
LEAPARLTEAWAMDLMANALYDGRGFRTFNVLDEGNRQALAIEVGTSIPSARLIRVLDDLIRLHGQPTRVRVDNEPEVTAEAFVDYCAAHCDRLHPARKTRSERLHQTIQSELPRFREEVLDAYLFDSLEQVREITDAWLEIYNTERAHDSLGQVPPLAFLPRLDAPVKSTFEVST